ncbi:recombinase family protein [Enterobacter hormaechei]
MVELENWFVPSGSVSPTENYIRNINMSIIEYQYPSNSLAAARAAAREKYYFKVRPIVEELMEYGYGETALANALNNKGVLTSHGKEFNAGTVKHLLKMLGYKD